MITEQEKILRLQTWLSPSFPIGGYSFSHALESAIEAGLTNDRQNLTDWLATDIAHGSGRVDVIFLAAAWKAATEGDEAALVEAASLASALRGTSEFSLESQTQGAAFMSTVSQVWPSDVLAHYQALLKTAGIAIVIPIAVGMAAAAEGLPLQMSASMYLHALVANLVSAAVRGVPLGQTDGQRVLAALEGDIATTAQQAIDCGLDDVGSATVMIDILSMQHETQYTRIFRS